jgi:gas vesicle protein
VSEQFRVVGMAAVGALVGAAAGYLFFTERGRVMRDRMEPAIDDLRHEFMRFQGTIQKLGDMASDGMRVVNEFQAARAQGSPFPQNRTSH